MTKFLKRIGIIILFCVMGGIAGHYYGEAILNGDLIQWNSLGKPPAMPTEIAQVNYGIWIKVANGEIYHYNDAVGCKENCWKKENSIPSIVENTLPLENCTKPRQNLGFVIYQGVCKPWGPGFHVIYYGVTTDGTIYEWEAYNAEGNAIIYLIAPYVGLFLGLALSVIIVIVLYIIDWIKSKTKTKI